MRKIDKNAIVSSKVELGKDVKVGAFAIIEEGVKISDGCEISAGAHILEGTEILENNFIGRHAVIGEEPQGLSFSRETKSGVRIGKNNRIREFSSVHRASKSEQSTKIGDNNFLMGGTHIGHDSNVGDNNIFANNVLLGGHVIVGNNIFFGGGSVFHQFVRVGDFAMIRGGSAFSMDVPPYVNGLLTNKLAGINVVGLKRAGFSSVEIMEIRRVFRDIFFGDETVSKSIEIVKTQELCDLARKLIDFFTTKSIKGISSPQKKH